MVMDKIVISEMEKTDFPIPGILSVHLFAFPTQKKDFYSQSMPQRVLLELYSCMTRR